MLQFPVNSKLDPAHRKQRKPGFRLSGLDEVSEPELPFPDPGYLGSGNAVFDAFVDHGNSPALRRINTAGTALFHAKCIFFPKMDLGNIVAASVPASAIAPASDQMVHSFGWAARLSPKRSGATDGTLFLPGELRGFSFAGTLFMAGERRGIARAIVVREK